MRGRGMHGRGACMVGGHAWWGACVAGSVHGRGRVWWRACVVGGVCGRGVMCGGGMHGGGHVWQGVRGTHAFPLQILQDMVIRSMSGRYASYCNGFFLTDLFILQ